jgi:hypothetical protein
VLWWMLCYLLFAAACVPGIGVQPRCCPTTTSVDCSYCPSGGIGPGSYQVTISGVTADGCGDCSHYNDTFLLAFDAAVTTNWIGAPACGWRYEMADPCQPGEVIEMFIWWSGGLTLEFGLYTEGFLGPVLRVLSEDIDPAGGCQVSGLIADSAIASADPDCDLSGIVVEITAV